MWNTHLFGKRRDEPPLPPASLVGIRCARIRMARQDDLIRPMLLGYAFGGVYFISGLLATVAVDARLPLAGLAGAAWERTNAASFATALALFVAIVWGCVPAFRWLFDRRARHLKHTTVARRHGFRRTQRRAVWTLAAAFFALLVCSVLLRRWGLISFSMAVPTTAYGTWLLFTAWSQRRGSRLVCARCDYPMGSWRGAAERCPECGNPWREPWRARFGQRVRPWPRVMLGVAMLMASALAFLSLGLWGLH